jgi:endonuclease III
MWSESAVARRLLELTKTLRRSEFFPTYDPKASELVGADPYAFALAVSLNRQAKAKRIWMIPFELQEELGHLDPARIAQMSLMELERVFRRLPHKPRFVNDAPRTVKELSNVVMRRFDGNAALIWENRSAANVKRTFQQVFGVGPQIANLSVLLLEQRYGISFSDRRNMDIEADVRTCRVLHRLGVARDDTPEEAIAAARRLYPAYPGKLDAPIWIIGGRWCHPAEPECLDCPANSVCQYASAKASSVRHRTTKIEPLKESRMRKGYVEVAFVLDETGSMHEIREDTIGGFNQWLEEQKELDVEEMRCSLVLFSKIEGEKTYRIRHQGILIEDVDELDGSSYRPRGTTPLLDAIGITIDSLGTRLDQMDENERPEKVIVAILTDGLENASEEYTLERVKEMVTHQQEKYIWLWCKKPVGEFDPSLFAAPRIVAPAWGARERELSPCRGSADCEYLPQEVVRCESFTPRVQE